MNDTAYTKFLRQILQDTNKELERVLALANKAVEEMHKTNSVYREVKGMITPENIIGGE